MRTLALSFLIAVRLLATSSAFTFTSPPAGAAVNLSSTIDIVWTLDNNEGNTETNLKFNGQSPSGGTSFSYDIASNISISQGNYLWNTTDVYQALLRSNNTLSNGADFSFTAELHNNGSSAGAQVTGSMFKIDGISLVSAGALLHPQAGFVVIAVVLFAMLL
jgi:hypothetical protein